MRGPSSRRRRPISAPAARQAARVARLQHGSSGVGEGTVDGWHRRRGRDRRPRRQPVSVVASTPPSRVRTERRTPSPRSLKRMATSALADWASRSMSPSDICLRGARRLVVLVGRPRTRSGGHRQRSRGARAHARRAAAAHWAWCGRCVARSWAARRRPRPALTPPAGSVAWCWSARSWRCRRPGPRSGSWTMSPPAASKPRPRCGSSSVTCSQVAAASASTQVDRPEARVRDVVVDVDDGHALEERRRSPAGPLPMRSRSPQSQTTMRSGSRSELGREADALDAGHEVVHRGHRVRADGLDAGTERLERQGDAERGAERIGVRVLVTDGQHPPGPRAGARGTSAGTASRSSGSSERMPSATTALPGFAQRHPVHATAVAGRQRVLRGLPASAVSLREVGVGRSGTSADGLVYALAGALQLRFDLLEQLHHAGAALGAVVLAQVQVAGCVAGAACRGCGARRAWPGPAPPCWPCAAARHR